MKKNIIRRLMVCLERILEPLASKYFEKPMFIIYECAEGNDCHLHND